MSAPVSDSPPSAPLFPLPGEGGAGQPCLLAGRYQIEALIGRGAIGAVYRALDLRDRTPCAIKILHQPTTPHHPAYRRFTREARIVAGLFHPNIVEIRDFALAEDGTPFLIMELLHGSDLFTLTRGNKRLPPPYALDVLSQVGSALEAMHSIGVVHRDIKLQNIFLCNGGTIKLVDFGLATTLGGEQMTRVGSTLGTPEYLAPEGCCGRSHALDAYSDQWSLGVVAYRLLCGQLPFRGSSPLEVELLVSQARPVPLTQWIPNLSPHICEAVHRALSLNKQDRFASVEAFIAALRQRPLGAPVSGPARGVETGRARTEAAPEDIPIEVPHPRGLVAVAGLPRPHRRKRRWPLLVALAGTGLLLSAAGATLWGRHKPAPVQPGGASGVLAAARPGGSAGADSRPSTSSVPRESVAEPGAPERGLAPGTAIRRFKPRGPGAASAGPVASGRRAAGLGSPAPGGLTAPPPGPLPAASAAPVAPAGPVLAPEPIEPAPAPPPRPNAITTRRIESCGSPPRIPPELQRELRGQTLHGQYELCMDREGKVLSVKAQRSIQGADAAIIATLRTWRCAPWPVPSCSVVDLAFDIE
ncbi:MAG: serine/threonine-protein kinase [Polyangia bacterium]